MSLLNIIKRWRAPRPVLFTQTQLLLKLEEAFTAHWGEVRADVEELCCGRGKAVRIYNERVFLRKMGEQLIRDLKSLEPK